MILYVKEFIKMGNTPFEYSSRLDTCLKSMILLWSLFEFLSMTYKQRITNWDLIVCLGKFDILRIVVLKLYVLRKMIIIATT